MKKIIFALLLMAAVSGKNVGAASPSYVSGSGALMPSASTDCSTYIEMGKICTDSDTGPYIFCVGNGTTCDPIKRIIDADNDGYPDKAEDLVISGQTTGDVIYFDGAKWSRMAKGSNNSLFGVNGSGTLGFYTSLTILLFNSNDPDVATLGHISQDNDGANVTGDVTQRGFDGANQFLFSRKLHPIHVSVYKPQNLADAVRDKALFWENESGMTYTITRIKCWSGTDDTSISIEEYDADGQNNVVVDTVEIATNGTGLYYQEETTISNPTIEAGHLLAIDFDDTDDPDQVKCTIVGWFDANVD